MALHVGYETLKPWKMKRVDVPDEKSKEADLTPKPLLKADKDKGIIVLNTETQLAGVPPEAWKYMLGNRSALEWVLDQYKEKRPKDPTIRAKFNSEIILAANAKCRRRHGSRAERALKCRTMASWRPISPQLIPLILISRGHPRSSHMSTREQPMNF